jgi:hypothetical protein
MLSTKESKEYSTIGSLMHLPNKRRQILMLMIKKNNPEESRGTEGNFIYRPV